MPNNCTKSTDISFTYLPITSFFHSFIYLMQAAGSIKTYKDYRGKASIKKLQYIQYKLNNIRLKDKTQLESPLVLSSFKYIIFIYIFI